MQSKYPFCIYPTRGIRVSVDFLKLKSGNILAGVISIFGPICFRGEGGVSLVPVPLVFSVESENTVQIVLNCFVLTLSAVYGYAVAKIQETFRIRIFCICCLISIFLSLNW